MTERRYSEEEVAAIFEKAEEAQRSGRLPARSSDGLTLDELEAIGREVGIRPEHIQEAARGIGRAGGDSTRRFAGFPLGVGRTIQLDRRLTDEEWQRLVVDLRQTFDARGKIRAEGGFREWANGNLQVLVEPTPEGDRLRLRTLKGSARALMTTGMAMAGVAGLVLLVAILTGTADAERFRELLTIGTIGIGLFGFSALRLPGWARERRQQMEAVSDRMLLATRATASPDEDDSGLEP